MMIDLKVVKSCNCEERSYYVGNPHESFSSTDFCHQSPQGLNHSQLRFRGGGRDATTHRVAQLL